MKARRIKGPEGRWSSLNGSTFINFLFYPGSIGRTLRCRLPLEVIRCRDCMVPLGSCFFGEEYAS